MIFRSDLFCCCLVKYTLCGGERNYWLQIQQKQSFVDAGSILLLSDMLNGALEVKVHSVLEMTSVASNQTWFKMGTRENG